MQSRPRTIDTKNHLKGKFKIFSQSYVIDATLAKRHLNVAGFNHIKLDNPILYRGDERSPDIIFKEGFYRRIENSSNPLPSITSTRASENCVACTKNLIYAVGFADAPNTANKIESNKNNKAYGWVYMLYAESGIDLANDKLYEDNCANNVAKLVNEVSVTGVPSQYILAAFQIKTTNNDISIYCTKNTSEFNAEYKSWQLLVTDYAVNENCIIKDLNPELYEASITNFFSEIKQKGYYRIPWSPYPEETDFLITHDLSFLQKQAYREFGLTKEEAKKIHNYYQIEALKLNLSAAEVLSCIKSEDNLLAFKAGVDLSLLLKATPVEVYGLKNGLTFEQVKNLCSNDKIDGMLLGFTREDVLSAWFSQLHLKAIKRYQMTVDTLRHKTEIEICGIINRLPYELVQGLSNINQIRGLLVRYSREDVLSEWFSDLHVIAINDRVFYRHQLRRHQLRGLPRIEVFGLLRGLSLEKVKGLKNENQIHGMEQGFKKEDVLSAWFDHSCLLDVKAGISIDEIRKKRVELTLFNLPSEIVAINISSFASDKTLAAKQIEPYFANLPDGENERISQCQPYRPGMRS